MKVFYHNQRGLGCGSEKKADRSAVAKGLLEEDQEDTRVLYVALTGQLPVVCSIMHQLRLMKIKKPKALRTA